MACHVITTRMYRVMAVPQSILALVLQDSVKKSTTKIRATTPASPVSACYLLDRLAIPIMALDNAKILLRLIHKLIVRVIMANAPQVIVIPPVELDNANKILRLSQVLSARMSPVVYGCWVRAVLLVMIALQTVTVQRVLGAQVHAKVMGTQPVILHALVMMIVNRVHGKSPVGRSTEADQADQADQVAVADHLYFTTKRAGVAGWVLYTFWHCP